MGLPSGPQIPSPTSPTSAKGDSRGCDARRSSSAMTEMDGIRWHGSDRYAMRTSRWTMRWQRGAEPPPFASPSLVRRWPRRAGLVAACVAFALVLALIIYMQFFAS